MYRQGQMPQYIPRVQYAAPVPYFQRQLTVGDVIGELLGTAVVVGLTCTVAYGVGTLIAEIVELEKAVRRCSECGRTNHDARNCPLTGARTRLRMEKTGDCTCCRNRFRYTEAHHYAARCRERSGDVRPLSLSLRPQWRLV